MYFHSPPPPKKKKQIGFEPAQWQKVLSYDRHLEIVTSKVSRQLKFENHQTIPGPLSYNEKQVHELPIMIQRFHIEQSTDILLESC